MSDTKHTPEPWSEEDFNRAALFHVNDVSYLQFKSRDTGEVSGRSNVRRIVACVNACAGMADPEKGIAALRAAAEKARDIVVQLVDWRNQPYAGARYECFFCGTLTEKHDMGCISLDSKEALAALEEVLK